MNQLKANVCLASHRGAKPENQDSCQYHIPSSDLALKYKGIAAVMADGVSACDKAQEASSCCVQGFLNDYYSTPDSWRTEHSVTKVICALNNWLYSQSIRSSNQSSMLSTLSVLIVKSNTAHIFHVGDSRIYRLRQHKLIQLTHDHVLNISKNQTYLSRAVGFDLSINVDYQVHTLKLGDTFLLTTDGIHDTLSLSAMENQLNQQANSETLIQQALAQDAQDNVSAMIVQIHELPEADVNEVFNELIRRPMPSDLSKGMQINGFEIQSLIQDSTKTQIYLAKDIETEQLVALKTPSVNFEDDAQYLKHFMYEEWVGQRIQSPNVVKIHSSNQANKFLAYAMEYINGQTLKQWMHDNPKPPLESVINIMKQVIKGLRAFHRQEMLHCDLKPSNIMIDNIGQVRLIDFGSATIAGVAELTRSINVFNNKGTQGYTAPEVILEQCVSQASDQFSLGAIVYEILTGELPYKDKLDRHLTPKKLNKLNYNSSLEYDPHIPVWVDGAIAKACHLDKDSRYQALSEFLVDLTQPNPEFLSMTSTRCTQFVLKRYQLLATTLFACNVILLLLLVL